MTLMSGVSRRGAYHPPEAARYAGHLSESFWALIYNTIHSGGDARAHHAGCRAMAFSSFFVNEQPAPAQQRATVELDPDSPICPAPSQRAA
jgi:hypothetical protein